VIAEVIKSICGSVPTQPIPADACANVTETDLLLAMRPNQTADEYLERVLALAAKKISAPGGSASTMTLDDVGGMQAAVEWGRALARDLEDYKAGRIQWSDVDPGVLLNGAPGTGKTTFAKALAGTCGVPFVVGSLQDWQSSGGGYLGDLLKAMRAAFVEAQQKAPSILFIDEIDSFQARIQESGRNSSYHVQVVNQLLELLDGVHSREGVVVVAACNNADRLDPAIIRAGRLDTVIEIPLPGVLDLERIFRIHLGDDLPDADLTAAARSAEGHTGADVKRWIRRARRIARTARRPMTMADLIDAIDVPSLAVTDAALRRYAVHEAGHALFIEITRPGGVVVTTVRQSAKCGGFTVQTRDDDWQAATETKVRWGIAMALAGMAAEKLVYGEGTCGAGGGPSSDLASATHLAVAAISTFGLGDVPMWFGEIPKAEVGEFLAKHPAVAAEAELMLVECFQQALDLLTPRRNLVETLADMLVEQETISGAIVKKLIESESHTQREKFAKLGPSNGGRRP
jgi:ATP-dependent Zn protease